MTRPGGEDYGSFDLINRQTL